MFLPHQPRDEQGSGGQALAHRLGGVLLGIVPPVEEGGGVVAWGRAGQAQPSDDLVPDLSRKRALDDQVVHGLWCLIAQRAGGVMRQASPSQALSHPAAVKVGKPVEEFDTQRRPTLPDQFPRWRGSGAMEGGQVA